MTTIANLVVNLQAQTTQFRTSMSSAQAQLASVEGSAAKTSIGLKTAATAGFAIAGAAAIQFAANSVRAASDQEEALNKVAVVFEGTGKAVRDFAATSAEAAGISKAAALDAAAGFGQMLQTAGLATDASAQMSVELVQLAADLASFNNIDPTEALEKLRSGLAGEAEPLRVLGVFLSEARVQAEAYASGIAETGAELTEAQKVQARYNLILQDTAKAQGDFARTSDSLANQQRQAQARFADLQAELGQKLIPVLNEALPLFIELAETALPLIAEGMTAVVNASEPFLVVLREINGLLEGDVLPTTENWTDRLKVAGDILGFFNPALKETSDSIDRFRAAEENAAAKTELYNDALSARDAVMDAYIAGTTEATEETRKLAGAHNAAAEAARAQKAAEDILAGGMLGLFASVEAANEAQREVNRLQRAGKTDTQAYTDAQIALLEAQLGVRSSAEDLAAEMKENGAKAADVRKALVRLGKEAGLAGKDARALARDIQGVTDKANGVPPIVKTTVKADISQAREALNTLLGLLRQVSGGAAIAVRAGINAVPRFAKGGIVTKPTFALIGEEGPEAVVPLKSLQEAQNARRALSDVQNARQAILHAGSQAIRRTMTAKEAQEWRQAMRSALRTEGSGPLQRQLMQNAARAIFEEGTAAEAQGFRRSVRDVNGDQFGPRIDIHLDRRRFAGQLAYDHNYRGW